MKHHEPTVSRLEYRPAVKLLSAAAGAADALGLPIGTLDEDSVLRAACRSTGLDDWGDDRFREPFRRVLAEVVDAPITSFARVVLRQSWIRAVSNRLWLREWVRRHPEVRNHKVRKPIFVLGFPRTGTTLLQNLLALDPRRRGLEFWECTTPVPVHEDRQVDRRRRMRTTQRMLDAAYFVAPEMARVHYIDVTTLEEDWPLFANSFTVMNWDLQSGFKEYGDWLMSHWDMVGPYQEFRRYLQVILDRNPAEQLVLKCPEHLWFVDALLEVFPDACIVWTHRDPYSTIASYCSLMSMQWRTLYGRIDPAHIGAHLSDRLLRGIERAMDVRGYADPGRFYDVRFDELVADPAAVVRDLSRHFELDWWEGMDQAMAGYLGQRRADARGNHRYDGDMYGLDRAAIHRRYADYIDFFEVKVKAA